MELIPISSMDKIPPDLTGWSLLIVLDMKMSTMLLHTSTMATSTTEPLNPLILRQSFWFGMKSNMPRSVALIQSLKVNHLLRLMVHLLLLDCYFILAPVANNRYLGCGETFMAQTSFHIHLRQNSACSKAYPQTFTCYKSSQQFNQLEHVQGDVQTHENNTEDEHCSYRGNNFMCSDLLQRHLRTHKGDKPYQCEHCGKSFNQSGTLQVHLRTHTGDKPYQCEHCGKSFSQSGSLQGHLRTHTGDKPYQCEHCGKSFNQSGTLQVHLRTHTGDKPYQCEQCGKSFSRNDALQRHLKAHTGDKPYKCEHCGKSFNDSSNLQRHVRTHTGDKPYKCEHCGKSFS